MHEASDLFKKAISQKNRELRIRTTIDSIEYSGADVQSCNIEESILTEEDFKFGSATASMFELTLLNMDESLTAKSFEGKEVHIEIGAVIDKFKRPVEFVSMGYFIIEEASKEKSTIKLTGFDKMILFEQPYTTNLMYPATLRQIYQEVCGKAGLATESLSFTNSDYVVRYKPDLEGVTLRRALEYLSELACGFARINRSDKVEIVSLTNSPLTIDKSNYFNMNLSEYEYGPIDYVVINNEGIIEGVGEGESILEIKDNIYAFGPSEELLNTIFAKIAGFKFKPFTSSWQGNVLTAPGDIIEVSYKAGEAYQSFIAKQKFTFTNGLKCTIETNAKTKMQIDYETKGTVTAEMGRIKSTIRNMGDSIQLKVEEIETSISSLEMTSDNIIAQVEAVDQSVAALDIRADNIQLSVSDLSGRMGNAESQISIQAGQITQKVSRGDVISSINQSPEAISINANKINLVGSVNVLSEISGELGTINSGMLNSVNINTQNSITVGSTLNLGASHNNAFNIRFGGPNGYSGITYANDSLSLSALERVVVAGNFAVLGDVNFSVASNLIGVPRSYTSGLGLAYNGGTRLYVRINGMDVAFANLEKV